MGIRSRLRASSHNRRTPSPQPQQSQAPPITYGALPPDAPTPVILSYTQPAPTIAILSQATDSKPLFQINYTPNLTVTHIPSALPIGTITAGPGPEVLTLHLATPKVDVTYGETENLSPPSWFRSFNGNAVYWSAMAFNRWQMTMYARIVDGVEWGEGDERDVAVAIILDSQWRKGRIEFRKAMGKNEMDFMLLSAIAEIENLRGRICEGSSYAGSESQATAAVASGSTAGEVQGYLGVATAGINLATAISGGGGGGGGA